MTVHADEIAFLMAYGDVQHNPHNGRLWGLLLALPVILANGPSEAFLSILSTHCILREGIERIVPTYRTDARHALIATAIDAVEARTGDALLMNQDLQTQLT